ncbi:alpha/beta fold hydrolase [Micromonospora parathelypteridis]|uniref:Pimeloyl-ACP methyl ester carboxylesterase n=1 Tax=Micromonospora parathelypteridis TaxID=1839617 RepID=A0A840WED9_9ACTN|nr:alpha/beta fold hydrolase [Micromonospora parathelypteridis]MBB5481361.1 pimeloyl-ACP methyl ester carboxylesterase [Micromonospora parathelypteridis]GGO18893.1 alpha/beta hydrolase [Micromonospora parathelypteridis]
MSVYRHPGTIITDHRFQVPLDHADPAGERIEVYAREVVAAGKEREPLPWLLFLQGGPGGRSPRPVGRDNWLDRALDDYRVLLLDQRGTGRSTPADRNTLPLRGDAAAQARYLAHFRADSIVRDCELIRRELLGEDGRWSLLGQSYGGFCTLTYLSYAPDGVREAFVTGGLPGLRSTADDVYRAAYPRVRRKVEAHYARYPQDVETVRAVVRHLREREVRLPGGGLLTAEAFQAIGIMLGTGNGSHALHYLLEDAFLPGVPGQQLSDPFLAEVQGHLSYAGRPLYALLHESIYGQRSVTPRATGWAAEAVRAEFPAFDADRALAEDRPVLLTGEMIYPWMVVTDPALAPLAEAAELLARRTDWPDLYDPERLARNEVPVAAAIYHDDMYVDTDDSLATARAVRGLRPWITNEYEHDGLRVSEGRVLDRLIRLVRGEL